MDFFREKNNRYIADSLSGNPGARSTLRIGILFIAAGVFAFVVFLSPMNKDLPDKTPLIIGMGVFILVNIIAILLRSAGHGSGIIVDQMNGTLSYRKPGGNRHTVTLSSLKGIMLSMIPGRAAILSLEKADGGRHIVMYCSDTMKMRMFAGELSTLTSLTVTEEIESNKFKNA